ncbi:helicase [Bacillus salacetis]|uniref:Helicase n=1 Tax=Bacillus salacetis TaxID=2315464 RepID=A0A3A1QSJ4_9BACI|nr:RNA polymerase recycling motor HelD [Bacillus salacetis]RIW30367.1 helicase [Bacillus salacetis]
MANDTRLEQNRLDHVTEVITGQIEKLEDETAKRRNEVVNIRRNFWDEVKVNTDTFDDYLETIISLRQQAQDLSVSQSTHRHASKKLSTLKRMKDSPYFGKISFLEKGEGLPDEIYIGIATLTDKTGENFLVYDWRAPVSSVYYDYGPGPAEYSTPGGTVKGSLEKKWQYIIRKGELLSMFDTSLTIGDEILQRVLGKSTDNQMHSIVATIQREQNEIIRHDRGRLLIVQGAAGSGKTSAAMQRIAYLLYKYRDKLNADQIILFSPNTMFNSYVSNVLPELGEENMQQVTFQEYLDHRLSKYFDLEGPYDQLEYVLTAVNESSYKTRLEGIHYKASTDFFEAIKDYRLTLETKGMLFKRIKFRGEPLLTPDQIRDRFYNQDTELKFINRLEKLTEWVNEKVDEAERRERTKPWVEEEIELLSNEEYHKAVSHLRKTSKSTEEEFVVDHEALGRLIVHQKFRGLRRRIENLEFINIKGIYRQLFVDGNLEKASETSENWSGVCRSTVNMLDDGKMHYEDAAPYLFLQELILGFQTNTAIKHIIIDEAQDYSPFQFEFLKRLFPYARMTVLGDFNQAVFAHASEKNDFNMLMDLYGPGQTDVINLTRSYRSTKPIIDFTSQLVRGTITPFEREGKKPMLKTQFDRSSLHSAIESAVADMRLQDYNTIAIICKSAEESENAFKDLKEKIDGLKLVKSDSLHYEQGVVVIPAYLAKGIEFDAVAIYDASAKSYSEESLRKLFYTACTRAMHELQLFSIGEPSPFLKDVPSDCLIRE